jgi:hypothetical protein
MAVTTTVLVYFVDLLPQVVDDNMALISSNNNSSMSGSGIAQDN